MKPRLLDLFCGAGGAGMGYHRAGFDVVGVDLAPQPHYPFEFIQAGVPTVTGWYDRYCGWLLAHRDKHNCGCQCRLAPKHSGRHQCEIQKAEGVRVV